MSTSSLTPAMKPGPYTPPRGIAVQALYVLLLLSAVATTGLLRAFHHRTPSLFDKPLGSLLGISFVAFILMHLVQRREKRDLFPPLDHRGGLRPGLILPLLLILLGEKWLSVDLLENAFDWIDWTFQDPRLAESIYLLWTGLALTATSLLFLWFLRQSRHRVLRLVTGHRVVRALGLTAIAALSMGLLVLTAKLAAGPSSTWAVAELPANIFVVAGMAQIARAASEEMFYRGLLQTGMIRLLTEAGLGEGRTPRLIAIGSISCGFALEHYDPAATPAANFGTLIFVFAMSCALGTLLEVSRNLFVVIASHATINLCVAGLLPLPISEDAASGSGEFLLPPALAGVIFMMIVFGGVALRHALRKSETDPQPQQ